MTAVWQSLFCQAKGNTSGHSLALAFGAQKQKLCLSGSQILTQAILSKLRRLSKSSSPQHRHCYRLWWSCPSMAGYPAATQQQLKKPVSCSRQALQHTPLHTCYRCAVWVRARPHQDVSCSPTSPPPPVLKPQLPAPAATAAHHHHCGCRHCSRRRHCRCCCRTKQAGALLQNLSTQLLPTTSQSPGGSGWHPRTHPPGWPLLL